MYIANTCYQILCNQLLVPSSNILNFGITENIIIIWKVFVTAILAIELKGFKVIFGYFVTEPVPN
jgi:hypothetical protein